MAILKLPSVEALTSPLTAIVYFATSIEGLFKCTSAAQSLQIGLTDAKHF